MLLGSWRSRTRSWRSRTRTGAGLLIAVGLVLTFIAFARPAAANPHIDLRGPGVKVGDAWLGSYRTFLGEPWVWCIDSGKKSPFAEYDWTARAIEAPQEAYLLWKHAPDTQKMNHAALSFLLHKSAKLPHDVVRPIADAAPDHYGPKLRARVDALQREAERFAGPYTVDVSLSNTRTGSLGTTSRTQADSDPQVQVVVEIRSASGQLMPDVPVTLEISGSGQWEDSSQKMEVTSNDKVLQLPVDITGSGELTVEATAKTPPIRVQLFEPDNRAVQRVVSALGAESQSGSDILDVPEPLEISISTRASVSEVVLERANTASSDDASDIGPRDLDAVAVFDHLDVEVVAGEWPNGRPIPVVSTLYGPFDTPPNLQDTVPDDAVALAAVTTEITEPGAWRTAEVMVTEPGWYVWHEEVAADPKWHAWAGQFGVPEETFQVLEPVAEPPEEPEIPEEPEPQPEPEPEPEPEVEPEPEPEGPLEPEPEPEPEPGPENGLQDAPVNELPRTGGSLALGLIGGGALLAGVGTIGMVRGAAPSGNADKPRR